MGVVTFMDLLQRSGAHSNMVTTVAQSPQMQARGVMDLAGVTIGNPTPRRGR
jgi:hypothetical protein